MPALPYPRLELRWRKPTKAEIKAGHGPHLWLCDYMLVLKKKTDLDARSNGPKGAYGALDVEYVLETTVRDGGGEPVFGDTVDTPFRDGCRAQWDSRVLNIPAYAVYGKKSTKVVIRR